MKKILIFSALLAVNIACQNSKDIVGQKLPKRFDKNVGEQISLELAMRWVNNRKEEPSFGKDGTLFSVSAASLSDLLVSNKGSGVVLYHGMDDTGSHHLLMFTPGAAGELFRSAIVELSTGEIINSATAQSWATNYAIAHPATPWYHFFGNDIFDEIQSNPDFDYINVVKVLNDENEEQLLLFVFNTKKVLATRAEAESVTVYSASYGCPPCTPEEHKI